MEISFTVKCLRWKHFTLKQQYNSVYQFSLLSNFNKSFWQSKKVVVPHIIGASTAFGGSVVYSWLLVYISWYYMSKSGYRKAIICFRLILAIIESVCGIIRILYHLFTHQVICYESKDDCLIASSYNQLYCAAGWLLIIDTSKIVVI